MSVDASDTILLIDDEPHYMGFLVEAVIGQGYVCDVAENLGEGVEKLRQKRYAAVIVDLSIPTSGYDAALAEKGEVFSRYPGLYAAEFARNNRHSANRVIVYSVHDDDGVDAVAKKINCTYLLKGRPRQFKQVLRAALPRLT